MRGKRRTDHLDPETIAACRRDGAAVLRGRFAVWVEPLAGANGPMLIGPT